MKRAYGFTIVELLIVIVVIAILAALSYVGYANISQRARNATIINAASSSVRLLSAYVVEKGAYPISSTSASQRRCITLESGCITNAGIDIGVHDSLTTTVAAVGMLPVSVPSSGDRGLGIIYQYTPTWTVDGVSQPAGIIYWLDGIGQNCGIPGVLADTASATTLSTTGYTVGNQDGKTRCDVTIPGPAHV